LNLGAECSDSQKSREEFRPEGDVLLLLRLPADKPDVLDESSGSRRPNRMLAAMLNEWPLPL
jgi:hypothetical protein